MLEEISRNNKEHQYMTHKHMRLLYDCITNGSMSTEFAASPLIGTAKLPNPMAPTNAANHPRITCGSDMVLCDSA